MKRKIITIDEEKCNGCAQCIPDCPEGALQIIDGKARLVSDLSCDGLGACLGACPEGALTVEEREAEPYDEKMVMEKIAEQGENTIRAHLAHLLEHGEKQYYRQALEVLKEKGIDPPGSDPFDVPCDCPGSRATVIARDGEAPACPGSRPAAFGNEARAPGGDTSPSQLGQWPVQLHLVNTRAPYFQGADVIIAADCTAYACGDFHRRFLKGRSIVIACPKLDQGKEAYLEKITSLVDEARVNTMGVIIMEVPCCRGLLALVQEGLKKAKRKIPLKLTVIGIRGEVISEEWL